MIVKTFLFFLSGHYPCSTENCSHLGHLARPSLILGSSPSASVTHLLLLISALNIFMSENKYKRPIDIGQIVCRKVGRNYETGQF